MVLESLQMLVRMKGKTATAQDLEKILRREDLHLLRRQQLISLDCLQKEEETVI